MFILFIKFLCGALLLVLGAEWLVRGASVIARKFNIPPHVIGLTLVALGTSAPELFVNVLAAFDGRTEFAMANVSGSNLANLCAGFGLCSLLASAHIRWQDFRTDCLLLGLSPLIVFGLLAVRADGALPWATVVPLTAIFVYYLWSLRGREDNDDAEPDDASKAHGLGLGIACFVGGVVALYGGGELMLNAAIEVADSLRVGADVIALTIVAFGTSIPDITASVVAARKGEQGIAAGNILGSNIMNVALVLNATLWVNAAPLASTDRVQIDYMVVAAVSLLIGWLAYRFGAVPKRFAWGLLVAYLAYLTARVMMA